MNVLIIGGTVGAPVQRDREYYGQYVDFFKQSASLKFDSIDVFAAMMDDLVIEVGEGVLRIYDTFNKKDLSEYGAFFFRGDRFRLHMDVIATINEYAHRQGIPVVNDYSNVRDSSKLLQATTFESLDVPVAKTLNVNTALLHNFELLSDWKFPCIMKAKHGSHGNDNYVVQSLSEVRAIHEQSPEKGFVLQRFIPNDGDYRILIIGDQTIIIGRSAQEGSHLNNTSKGGTATEVAVDSLPEKVLQQARTIAEHYKMSIAGVDALRDKDTGEFFFLEVNAQPQLMTGAFTKEKSELLGALLEKIEGKQ